MPTIIGSKADVGQIEEHIREAQLNGLARGGDIAAAAEARLGSAIADIDAAAAARKAAVDEAARLRAALMAQDAKTDPGIAVIRDLMWNALGRPRQSTHLDQVFPGGVKTYTGVDPRQKPLLMQVLKSRILACAAPALSPAVRAGWAADVEALRVAHDKAVAALLPAEAAAHVTEVGYRMAARAAQPRLRAFKQDLENLGLSKTHIFEIIPDATPATSGNAGKTNGNGDPPARESTRTTGPMTDAGKAA